MCGSALRGSPRGVALISNIVQGGITHIVNGNRIVAEGIDESQAIRLRDSGLLSIGEAKEIGRRLIRLAIYYEKRKKITERKNNSKNT